MTPAKTFLLVLAAIPAAPFVVAATVWTVNTCLDLVSDVRRKSPELAAAIARHPSMHRTLTASYPVTCCNTVLRGYDPLDLVARQLHHESVCVRNQERAA
jgi:hypothetical protein